MNLLIKSHARVASQQAVTVQLAEFSHRAKWEFVRSHWPSDDLR